MQGSPTPLVLLEDYPQDGSHEGRSRTAEDWRYIHTMRLPSLGGTTCMGQGFANPRTLMETSGISRKSVLGIL